MLLRCIVVRRLFRDLGRTGEEGLSGWSGGETVAEGLRVHLRLAQLRIGVLGTAGRAAVALLLEDVVRLVENVGSRPEVADDYAADADL